MEKCLYPVLYKFWDFEGYYLFHEGFNSCNCVHTNFGWSTRNSKMLFWKLDQNTSCSCRKPNEISVGDVNHKNRSRSYLEDTRRDVQGDWGWFSPMRVAKKGPTQFWGLGPRLGTSSSLPSLFLAALVFVFDFRSSCVRRPICNWSRIRDWVKEAEREGGRALTHPPRGYVWGARARACATSLCKQISINKADGFGVSLAI